MQNTFRGLVLTLALWIPCARTDTLAPDAGVVHFIRTTNPNFDQYINPGGVAPALDVQEWLRAHFWHMIVFTPFFDNKLPWYPDGLAYVNTYAIYLNSSTASRHPDWILKDTAGHNLYIPWGCSGGVCPQYAGDISDWDFRSWWIDQARIMLSKGYKGLFIDDANMAFRVADGSGAFVNPVDQNTGALMTWDDWRRYVSDFLQQIRVAFPNAELIHNSIWYAGPTGVRDRDPWIQRQIAAADLLNIEFGVNDPGLKGGDGDWSLNSLLGYIDRVHAAGKGVVIGGVPNDPLGREYALANYYLISTGSDALGSVAATPDNWWTGFDTNLGTPSGPRTVWNGLLRRDFSGGMVLVNLPERPAVSVHLPGGFTRIDAQDSTITSVTLGPSQGVVLLRP